METIADRIIYARKAKNLTQQDLANALNVNVKNISRWKLGQATPGIQTAAQLAQALGVSLDYLAGLAALSPASPLEQLLKSKISKLSEKQAEALKTLLETF